MAKRISLLFRTREGNDIMIDDVYSLFGTQRDAICVDPFGTGETIRIPWNNVIQIEGRVLDDTEEWDPEEQEEKK